jgi:hypothetical protein
MSIASGGQCGSFQPKVTGEGGKMKKILRNKTTSKRSPMPWGLLDP